MLYLRIIKTLENAILTVIDKVDDTFIFGFLMGNLRTPNCPSCASTLRADGVHLRVDLWYPNGQNPHLGPDPRCPQGLDPPDNPVIN